MARKIKFSATRETKLPKATTLGFAKWKATGGDFIAFSESYKDGSTSRRFARVIGVITECDSDGESGVGRLLVLAISDSGTFGYERWVKPEDVLECYDARHAQVFLGWLLGATPEAMHLYIRDDLETRRAATYRPE